LREFSEIVNFYFYIFIRPAQYRGNFGTSNRGCRLGGQEQRLLSVWMAPVTIHAIFH
jgi:hypothetical protein